MATVRTRLTFLLTLTSAELGRVWRSLAELAHKRHTSFLALDRRSKVPLAISRTQWPRGGDGARSGPAARAALRAEAGEFELLEREKHPGEAMDHLGVAPRVHLEDLRIQADRRGETLSLLETFRRIISRWRECERRNGHVVGQASSPSLAGRGGPLRQR